MTLSTGMTHAQAPYRPPGPSAAGAHGQFAPPPPSGPALRPIEGSQTLARIGDQLILASEVTTVVEASLAPYKGKAPPEAIAQQRKKMIRQRLGQMIQGKLIYADAKRNIPPEGLKKAEQQIGEEFEKTEVTKLMKDLGARSRGELDQSLRKLGSSLDDRRKAFVEHMISVQWRSREIRYDRIVTHADLFSYYEQQGAEFEFKGKARWQQIMVRHERFSNKDAAHNALTKMGNQVFGGARFEEVAKAQSHGTSAPEGGVHDWTNQDSLASKTLNEAIFSLPIGSLSRIIADDRGFHIIRVTERIDAGKKPFFEAQVEIKKTILQQRQKEAVAAFAKRIKASTVVWTIFDDAEQLTDRPRSPTR